MHDYELTIRFDKGYIAHPYWPEREKLINIQKGSGINRARSEDKRQKTLAAWLGAHDLTIEQYRELEIRANRPFYTLDGSAEIVVSAHQMHGMLAQACSLAPASIRVARAEQIRTMVSCGDLVTGKTAPDGVWERFVPVKSGTGQQLSNQRGLRSDPYIEKFSATGIVSIIDADLERKFRDLLEWAGREIGVGAARKMGWGRFTITRWKRA
jgi:hypothetical protein